MSGDRGADQCRCEQPGICLGFGPLQRRHEQAAGFLVPRPRQPVAPERDAEPQHPRGPLGVAGRVPGRAPQVRLLGVQPREPPTLVRPGQVLGRRLGDTQEVRAVRGCQGGGLVFARLGEPFGGELADGLQQPVAQGSPGWLRPDEALVRQRAEQVGDVEDLEVAEAAHRLGGVQVEALGEHRQPPQQRLLGPGQQRIGPLDRRPQGLLPLQRGAAAPGQQPEALVQPVVQAGQGHRAQPGGGQLDGERHAVQPPAHRHHQPGGLLVSGQADALRSGPVDEQRDCVGGLWRPGVRIVGSGQRQRRHPVNGLPADAERLAAGGQQMRPRAAPHDQLSGLGTAADQMLAVVQHDQDVLRGQRIDQRLGDRQARLPGDPQRSGNARRHRILVGDRRQLHQPDPVTRPVQQLGGHLQAQPGLAAPPGPGQRDQARGLHQRPDLRPLPAAADEPRQLGREIVRQRRAAQRAQRRELRPRALRVQLEDLFRAAQVLQPVNAQVRQRRARRERVPDQRGRRLGEQGLSPVRHGCQPGGAMNIQAHQAGGRLRRFTGMYAHPHPNMLPGGPGMCLDCLLHVQHRRRARSRRGEHGEEPVSQGVRFGAAVGGESRPDQRMVVVKYLLVGACPMRRSRAVEPSMSVNRNVRVSTPEA